MKEPSMRTPKQIHNILRTHSENVLHIAHPYRHNSNKKCVLNSLKKRQTSKEPYILTKTPSIVENRFAKHTYCHNSNRECVLNSLQKGQTSEEPCILTEKPYILRICATPHTHTATSATENVFCSRYSLPSRTPFNFFRSAGARAF